MLTRLVALTTCLFVVSCASTRMTSFRDPSAPDADFKTIFVVVAFSDLETRVIAEDAFVARLENFGVRGIPSYTVIPPPREYTQEEFAEKLAQSGADGVLLVSIADAYTVDVEVEEPSSSTLRVQLEQTDPSLPPQNVSAAMHGAPTGDPRLDPRAIFDSSTRENELGLTLTRPRIHTELRLFDVSSGQTAWVGTSQTRGGTATRLGPVMSSLAGVAGKELQQHGLIAP